VRGAAEVTTAIPSVAWQQRLANFRIIPRIETYPVITKFAKTAVGKLLILALFALGLRFAMKDWIPLSLGLAVITFVPIQGRILLTILTLLFTFAVPWRNWLHPLYSSALLVFVIAIGAMLFWLVSAMPRSFIGRVFTFERLLVAHRLRGLFSERHAPVLSGLGVYRYVRRLSVVYRLFSAGLPRSRSR
jgi:hypothetical protein